ncbi:hypothetical protein [Nonomuraea sp. NPDC003214]
MRGVEVVDGRQALVGEAQYAVLLGQGALVEVGPEVPLAFVGVAVPVDGGEVVPGDGAEREDVAEVVQEPVGGTAGGGVHVDVDRVDDGRDGRGEGR